MGICIQFGAVSGDWGYGKRIRERERDCVCLLLSGGELDGGKRAAMWVSPHMYVCMYVCIHMYVYICMYICVCTYIYIYIYMCVCVCVCVCVCAYCLLTLTGSRCKM